MWSLRCLAAANTVTHCEIVAAAIEATIAK